MKTSLMVMLAAMTVAVGCTGMREQERLAERERLKQEIRDELRAELGMVPMRQPTPPPPNSAAPVATESPSSRTPQTFTAPPPSVLSGGAEGRLLWGGGGLASARVRLVRMETFRSKRAADYRASDFYDGQTDAEGRYRFTATEPGEYKLLWVPPAADYWVRRLADRPDVAVESGRIGVAPEIETKRKLLGD